MSRFYFIILPFFVFGIVGCRHESKKVLPNNGVTFFFSADKEYGFLKQVIFDNQDFDNFVIHERSKEIGFDDVTLYTDGFGKSNFYNAAYADTVTFKKLYQGNFSLRVSDTDLILIYQQFMINKVKLWNKQNTYGRPILTAQQDQGLMNEMGKTEAPDSLSLLCSKLKVGGRMEMSHPIFYGNGRFALFTFHTIDSNRKDNEECNLYWLDDNGKWVKQQSLMSRLRVPKKFSYK